MQEKYIKRIKKRLPKDITFKDESNFKLTQDEFLGILSWIKYFNNHYVKYGKNKIPDIIFPVISKRLFLDFGLYCFPSDHKDELGLHVIYLSANKDNNLNSLINTWEL